MRLVQYIAFLCLSKNVHCISGGQKTLAKNLLKSLAKNPTKNLAKNLSKHLAKHHFKISRIDYSSSTVYSIDGLVTPRFRLKVAQIKKNNKYCYLKKTYVYILYILPGPQSAPLPMPKRSQKPLREKLKIKTFNCDYRKRPLHLLYSNVKGALFSSGNSILMQREKGNNKKQRFGQSLEDAKYSYFLALPTYFRRRVQNFDCF